MSEIVIKGLFDLLGIVVSACVGYLFAQRSKSKQVDEGIQAGVRVLLYDRIKHLGKKYIENGSISIEELEDLHSMHAIYHNDLGGNGFLDNLMKSVESLPLR